MPPNHRRRFKCSDDLALAATPATLSVKVKHTLEQVHPTHTRAMRVRGGRLRGNGHDGLLGWFYYGEAIDGWLILGAALIVAGNATSLWRENRR